MGHEETYDLPPTPHNEILCTLLHIGEDIFV